MLAPNQRGQHPDYCAANRATRCRTRDRKVTKPATAGCDSSDEREQDSAVTHVPIILAPYVKDFV